MSAEQRCPHAEQSVGWALHALEPAEEDALALHVPQCAICQELVRQTEDMVRVLALADEQQDPRPELKKELMAAVAATPQTPVDEREQPWASTDRPSVDSIRRLRPSSGGRWNPTDPTVGSKADDRSAPRWRSVRRRRLAAVVATIAVAVLGIGGFAVRQVQDSRQESAVTAQSEQTERNILAEVDRSGARHAILRGGPEGKVLAAVLLYQGESQVLPIALRPNAAEHTTYVLWGIGRGRPTPVGTFDVSSPDSAVLAVGSMPQADKYSGYAISIEESRTAPAAPTNVIASGQVAS